MITADKLGVGDLVVGGDGVGLERSVEAAFRAVTLAPATAVAISSRLRPRRRARGIDLHAHGGLLPPSTVDRPTPVTCAELLREHGVGEVVDLAQRHGLAR